MDQKDDNLKKPLVFGAIWLGSGIANLIVLGILTKASGVIPMFVKFGLPAISFVATTYYLQTGDLIKVIRWLFSRKKKELQEKYSQIPKNYGRVAIPITIALFFIGGAITSFWVDHFWPHVYRYLAVGAVWGVAWYQMLNKNYVHHGDM